MIIEIDPHSGFCFGVIRAIKSAEEALQSTESVACLGDIVHNGEEVNRLEQKGMKTVNLDDFATLSGKSVLFRAHGEPPQSYKLAEQHNITVIDATCPVVLQLQKRVHAGWLEAKKVDGQTVIYGKKGHAEVNGLVGQTNGEAIVISSAADLDLIDFSKPIFLFSQTTQNIGEFEQIRHQIETRIAEQLGAPVFTWHDTICRQVSNREAWLRNFSTKYDSIVFVSGKKSSNGLFLYSICKQSNPNTFMINSAEDLDLRLIKDSKSVGICGATSTPRWLMEQVAEHIRTNLS